MKKLIILFFIISFPIKAEVVIETGKHEHLGKNYTKDESCKIAEEKAKNNAIIKSIGETASSESFSNCSQVDGEYSCERNKFSLLQLNGDLTDSKILKTNYDKKPGSEILFCEITIEANVEPIKKNLDPNFQFDIDLNQKIFRSGEILEIKINTSKKMYMTIFQWLPYGGKKFNVVTKIFPNNDYNKNTNDLIEGKLNLKYETYFPEEINKNKVIEHLIFVASEERINWLNEYAQIEGLKKQFFKTNILMEKHYSGYMLIK